MFIRSILLLVAISLCGGQSAAQSSNQFGASQIPLRPPPAGVRLPKKFTVADREMGRDDNARRVCVLAAQWTEQAKG